MSKKNLKTAYDMAHPSLTMESTYPKSVSINVLLELAEKNLKLKYIYIYIYYSISLNYATYENIMAIKRRL